MFKKVAIIGPGLIGGSMGMALRRGGLADEVVGVGRRQVSLDQALRVGAIDSATLDLAAGLGCAELVVLATPIGSFAAIAPQAAAAMAPGAVFTDVASAKVSIIESIAAALASRPDVAYVPSHPMAGSEQTGPLAASADLFGGSVCILTPVDGTPPEALAAVERMWQSFGAELVRMTPAAHDRLVARISHVPHIAAAALMSIVAEETMHYCGGGLQDTTRIAASSPDLWMDIYAANRREIQEAIGQYIEGLRRMTAALERDDRDALREELAAAQRKRNTLSDMLRQRNP